MSKNGKTATFLGGMLIGSALGTVIGLLIAPRSGKQTRQIVKKSADAMPELAEDLSSSLQLQAGRLSSSALKNWDETLTRLQLAIASGLEAGKQEFDRLQEGKKSQSIPVENSECE